MSDLFRVGMILTLIGGILAIVYGAAALLGSSLELLTLGAYNGRGDGLGGIIQIVLGIILILMYQGRIHIADMLVLGIVIIVLGIFTNILVILGGILILIEYFTATSSHSRTTTRRTTTTRRRSR